MATINEIKNLALFTLGFVDNIDFTVLTDPTVMKVNRIYTTSKQFVLSNYFWRFSQKRTELTQRVSETSTFTVVAATNVITATFNMWNGLAVTLSSTDTLPAGLSTDTTYYLISVSGSTAKLSLTVGGVEIDITDVGTGIHTIRLEAVYNSPYKYLFKSPADLMVMRCAYTDHRGSIPVRLFELDNDGFHADDSTAFLWYIYDVDETLFPVYFIDYFKYKLALDLCFNLTGDADLLKLIATQEAKMLITAKNIDAKQVQSKTIKSSPFTAIRR